MILSEIRHKLGSLGPTAAIIAVSGLLMLGLLILEDQTWHRCLYDNIQPLDVCRQLRSDLTAGFIRYDETVADKNSIDQRAVIRPFNRVAAIIDNWLQSQTPGDENGFDMKIDSVAISELTQLKVLLDQFRAAAIPLWVSLDKKEIRAEDRRRLDLLSGRIALQAMKFEDALYHDLNHDLSKQQNIFTFIILSCIGIGLMAAYLLIQVVRRHRRTEKSLRESRQVLQSVLDTIPVRVFWKDVNSRYLGSNRLYAEDAGLDDPFEIIGKNDYQLAWRDEADSLRADDREIINTGLPRMNSVAAATSGDGRPTWQWSSKLPLKDSDDRIIGIMGAYDDITERVLADKSLRDSLQTSADIVDAIPSGLLIFKYQSPETLTLLEANPEARYLMGIENDQWRERTFDEILPAANDLGLTQAFLEVMKTGKTYSVENIAYRDDRIDGSFRIRAFRMPGDRLGVALENITERTRAYQALRESEDRFRFLYKNVPVMLYSVDAEGTLTDVNQYWLDKLGYERGKVKGRKIQEFLTAESGERMMTILLPEIGEGRKCREEHVQLVKKNGEIIEALLSVVQHGGKTDDSAHFNCMLVDVTDLIRSERRARKFFRAVEQSPSVILITDPMGIIEYVNPRFTDVTGYEPDEVLGKDPRSFNPHIRDGHHFESIREALEAGKTWSGNVKKYRKNGEQYWERLTVSPILDQTGRRTNNLAISEDITTEVLAYEKLADGEKASAIGLLAAGVAHEFKNYLCGIIGNASYTLEDIENSPSPPAVKQTLSTIINIAERANEIATSLLSYSQAGSEINQPEDLRLILDQTLLLVRKEMEILSVKILTYFEAIPLLRIAPGKIQQLIINLLTNARQAIASDGIIMISLTGDERTVEIRIGDTGGGINPDIVSRIYDPFFSTKGVWGGDFDTGTGMGLATCRNIACEHGGNLRVDSICGAGAVFTLTLPLMAPTVGISKPMQEVVVRPRIILETQAVSTVERYFEAAETRRILLYPVKTLSAITLVDRDLCDIIICDLGNGQSHHTAATEVFVRKAGIPYVLINGRNKPIACEALIAGAAAVYDGFPDLIDILNRISCPVCMIES